MLVGIADRRHGSASTPTPGGSGWVLARAFDRRGHWWHAASVARRAVRAARRCGDRLGQAVAHRNLAWANIRTGRFNQAHCQFRHALRLHQELGDGGVADTHRSLAVVYGLQGRHRDGLRHTERALDLYRAAGDESGQAKALNNLGWQLALVGEAERAVGHCQESLVLHRRVGDRHGEATTLDSLGYAYHQLGQPHRAMACYREAVGTYRELGDRSNTAYSLARLGDSHEAAGDLDGAHAVWQEALGLFDEVGHRDAEDLRAKLKAMDPRHRAG